MGILFDFSQRRAGDKDMGACLLGRWLQVAGVRMHGDWDREGGKSNKGCAIEGSSVGSRGSGPLGILWGTLWDVWIMPQNRPSCKCQAGAFIHGLPSPLGPFSVPYLRAACASCGSDKSAEGRNPETWCQCWSWVLMVCEDHVHITWLKSEVSWDGTGTTESTCYNMNPTR